MSHLVTTSEALQYLVEGPNDKIGYVKHFYFNEREWKLASIQVSTGVGLRPGFSPGFIQDLRRTHPIIPCSLVAWVDISSRRIFLKQDLDNLPPEIYQDSAAQGLHTTEDLRHLELHTPEGSFGKVEDLLFDYKGWQIEHFVIRTHKFFGGRHILISPNQVEKISWSDSRLHTTLHKSDVLKAPEYKHSDSHFQATHRFG